jgi:hypothetical protein
MRFYAQFKEKACEEAHGSNDIEHVESHGINGVNGIESHCINGN